MENLKRFIHENPQAPAPSTVFVVEKIEKSPYAVLGEDEPLENNKRRPSPGA